MFGFIWTCFSFATFFGEDEAVGNNGKEQREHFSTYLWEDYKQKMASCTILRLVETVPLNDRRHTVLFPFPLFVLCSKQNHSQSGNENNRHKCLANDFFFTLMHCIICRHNCRKHELILKSIAYLKYCLNKHIITFQ